MLRRSFGEGWGSSPRLRGALSAQRRDELARGLIPASAGSTSLPTHESRTTQAHPRVCGEHFDSSPAVRRPGGSSPRLRGARQASLKVALNHGLIPASAGSTLADKHFRQG